MFPRELLARLCCNSNSNNYFNNKCYKDKVNRSQQNNTLKVVVDLLEQKAEEERSTLVGVTLVFLLGQQALKLWQAVGKLDLAARFLPPR